MKRKRSKRVLGKYGGTLQPTNLTINVKGLEPEAINEIKKVAKKVRQEFSHIPRTKYSKNGHIYQITNCYEFIHVLKNRLTRKLHGEIASRVSMTEISG